MKKRQILLPGWLFVPAMVVFYELLLHFWTMEEFVGGRLAAVALFALGFGGLLGFISALLPGKGQKWFSVTVTALLAVLYLMEYFLNDAYRNFMTFETIFAGAEGVATDYGALIASLLLRNLWRIGLALIPVVLYAIFARCGKAVWKLRVILAGMAVLMYLLGFVVVQRFGMDAARFTSAYDFDSAVHSFGLNVALALDVVNGSDTENPTFVQPETMPPATETEPPAVEETEFEETEPEETEAPTEPPVVYGENVMALDFAALAESTSNSSIASVHSYVASLPPSMENEYTGLFKGKNLILITAEAFTAEVIDPERTPTLYRLANEGIKFNDYYQPAWGASTTSGEFSNVIGIVPTTGGRCMMEAADQNLLLTMGHQLQNLGYFSRAYHNHAYDYYNRHKTHENLGYDDYIAIGTGMEVKGVWPESDLEMMEFTVEQYIDQQPFSIYYMTVSGHSVYTKSGNAQARNHYDEVADMPYSEAVKCYFAANMELEYAMEYLVGALEEAGIADDTVIVISTDHYPYGLESSSTWGNSKDYLSELYGEECDSVFVRDHSALIIWSGCLEDMDIVVDTPVYSLDILPTLSNLFDVNYDSRLLVGRDVFSDTQPLVLWPNYSWKTEKGTYDASNRTFTPVEGVEVEEGYVDYISSIVKNKITYSTAVNKHDYFDYITEELSKAVG